MLLKQKLLERLSYLGLRSLEKGSISQWFEKTTMALELLLHCLITSKLRVRHYELFALSHVFQGINSWMHMSKAKLTQWGACDCSFFQTKVRGIIQHISAIALASFLRRSHLRLKFYLWSHLSILDKHKAIAYFTLLIRRSHLFLKFYLWSLCSFLKN